MGFECEVSRTLLRMIRATSLFVVCCVAAVAWASPIGN